MAVDSVTVPKGESRLVTELRIAEPLLNLVLQGAKSSTIRRGHVVPALPVITLVAGSGRAARVLVCAVDYTKTPSSLTDEDARADGFADVDELRTTLATFYSGLSPSEPLTVIRFTLEKEEK